MRFSSVQLCIGLHTFLLKITVKNYESAVFDTFWESASKMFGVEYSDLNGYMLLQVILATLKQKKDILVSNKKF